MASEHGKVWSYGANRFPLAKAGDVIGPVYLAANQAGCGTYDVGIRATAASGHLLRFYIPTTIQLMKSLKIGDPVWIEFVKDAICDAYVACVYHTEEPRPSLSTSQPQGATVNSRLFDYVVVETKKVVVAGADAPGATSGTSLIATVDEVVDSGTILAADDNQARALVGNALGKFDPPIDLGDQLRSYTIKLRAWA